MTRILVVEHLGEGGPGVFAEGARDAGAELDRWTPAGGGPAPRPLAAYAGLVVLGGWENVGEDDRHPHLAEELDLLDRWLGAGRAALGVCLGAQLIAAARGGAVRRSPVPEVGWFEVELSDAGRADPVLGFGPDRFRALEWHGFAIRPPAGAVPLASNATCLQAFRLKRAWGVQYHPEADDPTMDRWISAAASGSQPEAIVRNLRAGRRRHGRGWTTYGRELFQRFCAEVG